MRELSKDPWLVISQRNSDWALAHGRSLPIGRSGHIMAIVNVTPDSFSDGGRHDDAERGFRHALACLADGAAILDIGGESTRPVLPPSRLPRSRIAFCR